MTEIMFWFIVAEKSEDFVTVDELVMTEEEEAAAAASKRGQPKKRSRQAPGNTNPVLLFRHRHQNKT